MTVRSITKMLMSGYAIAALSLAGSASFCQSAVNADFKKHVLLTEFISEGVATGDVDKDGKIDILAGPYWFKAPDWKRYEITAAKTLNPGKEYSNSFLNSSMDVNQDGWTDLLVVGYPGTPAVWYENPKNKEGHWKKYVILDSVFVGNESPAFLDMDGDGRMDILCADSKAKQVVWLKSPVKKGDTLWTRFPISGIDPANTDRYTHGLGVGDINKDKRKDVIVRKGWWQAPSDPKQPNWTFHASDLGEECAHMHVFDVNRDGNMDVISSSAHKYGIWWHEQVKESGGNASWKHHELSKAFSQSHALALTDMNGDKHPDLVAGKRFFAHNDSNVDPGAHDPALLCWFESTKGKEPYFVMHQIDEDSGAGLNIVTQDINKDKKIDIVISNKKGVFFFENLMKK
ncbi:MAG: VCBS repeat-containing protein [Chitinophagaceae bacterium]